MKPLRTLIVIQKSIASTDTDDGHKKVKGRESKKSSGRCVHEPIAKAVITDDGDAECDNYKKGVELVFFFLKKLWNQPLGICIENQDREEINKKENWIEILIVLGSLGWGLGWQIRLWIIHQKKWQENVTSPKQDVHGNKQNLPCFWVGG